MLIQKGPNSMVTGKSTHNQRIERLWRDVYEGVLSYFYNLFYFMEDEGYLDPLKLTNLAALQLCFHGRNKQEAAILGRGMGWS